MAIKHGGNLTEVAARYGTDPADWVDLSTGVSPLTYPVGDIPASVWNRLPETGDGLETAAKNYYGAADEPIAVAGSQAAIMALPGVITLETGRCGTIALPRVGYKEHQHAWGSFERDGNEWEIEFYDDFPTPKQLETCDVVLLINPNNPSGRQTPRSELQAILRQKQHKGGYLILDEAFADCTPEISILNGVQHSEHLIVLRSVGKFFGLAGARAGFVFAGPVIKALLEETLGPWTVNGPARWVMKQALKDREWQRATADRIQAASQRLNQLLDQTFDCPRAGTPLFTTVYVDNAVACHDLLCQQQILTRLCDEKNAIRFGLPDGEAQWEKLTSALGMLAAARDYRF
ncbi:Threonine-phosphate decarboxylase [Vibrio aerogenes CECT 7868]|uniref:threonine-phosphate decarboxylase n=1 Tax=Vibrio aerogenes CECT 7868 TaxID=1216006 RepID=A0A1M6ABG2_9VIBR|nr:threonine-phosphate decarboxylase CobD [Vibrio aerogenes]SHI33830.1 Threonine-phosphate decarboxylase [Vibrio aerogenes CECT 7868]